MSDPIVVVGSGIAGALFAIRAAERADVLALSQPGASGSTPWAQGGVAGAVGPNDSPDSHAEDTIASGAGLVDAVAAASMCADAPRQIEELIALGVEFDRAADGRLALGREGAHSTRRVVHAGGDSTGARIAEALRSRLREHPRTDLARERAVALDVADGRARGVWTKDADGTLRHRPARAVVLATGGLGAIFLRTTNPPEALGDGTALAAAAGAALADLEFVQFHPTALAGGDGGLPLVSEAVRGEGAHLLDADGRRFMVDEHPMAELAPRDVVARAITRVEKRDGRHPTLVLPGFDTERARVRFPTVAAACAAHGLDLATDAVPVTPAAHYSVGGVLADLAGHTTVPGLYAIGECAATGVHGANRLASNSLLEAAVMAERAALSATSAEEDWPRRPLPDHVGAGVEEPREEDPSDLAVIQRTTWDAVGVERSAEGLTRAIDQLSSLAPSVPRNAALAVARAARGRDESRGAHFRRDHPEKDARLARRIAWLGKHHFAVAEAVPRPGRKVA